eukprot:2333364-Rhodomonas_salina.6
MSVPDPSSSHPALVRLLVLVLVLVLPSVAMSVPDGSSSHPTRALALARAPASKALAMSVTNLWLLLLSRVLLDLFLRVCLCRCLLHAWCACASVCSMRAVRVRDVVVCCRP